MKKKFGQNFLRNQLIINNIINFAEINNESVVYEVGAGDGSLTKEIIKKNPKEFLTIEIDVSLKEKLEKLFLNNNYKLIFGDALKYNESNFFKQNTIIIGNLPYNISLKLLTKWIFEHLSNNRISKMLLMFQKEVAERITSLENSKKYGRISILTSAVFEVEKIMDISKKDFFPSPKVDSVMLLFKPLKEPHFNFLNIKNLEYLTKNLFLNRRKKIKNKIIKIFDKSIIEKYKLQQYYNLRAENIDRNTFFFLAKLVN